LFSSGEKSIVVVSDVESEVTVDREMVGRDNEGAKAGTEFCEGVCTEDALD